MPSKTTSTGGEVMVRVTDAKQLEPGEVSRSLQLTQLQWNRCYEPIFKKQAGAKAKTTFTLTIDATGKLKSATVKDDELKDVSVTKCIETAMKTGQWPKPASGTGTATVELILTGK